eukprot:14353908-Heterocapsa_arctica.AAC.1
MLETQSRSAESNCSVKAAHAWRFLHGIGLSWMYSLGQKSKLGVMQYGPASRAQLKALEVRAADVISFLRRCDQPLEDVDWESEMKGEGVAHDGSEVYTAEQL